MKQSRRAEIVMPPILTPNDPGYTLETYTPRQAALYLHVSKAVVYVEVAKQALAHRRLGERGEILMSQADLDQWRERYRVPATVTSKQLRMVVGDARDPRAPLKLPAKRRFS